MFTKKLIAEGEMLLLRQVISERILSQNVVTVRTDISCDGNYKVVVGYEVDRLEG